MLATKSPVSRMLRSVSFGSPRRLVVEMPTSGGSFVIALKYENGATLNEPLAPTVETNAIGRGTMTLIIRRYMSPAGKALGSTITGLRSETRFGRGGARVERRECSGGDSRCHGRPRHRGLHRGP